jgi:cytochrome c
MNSRMNLAALAVMLAAVAATPAAAQDAKAGERGFAQCRACHSVVRGQNRIGPSLAGISGRRIASVPGFNYSAALKKRTGNWTDANMNAWLTRPAAWAPGTRMAFAGISDAKRRADMIAYLKTLK